MASTMQSSVLTSAGIADKMVVQVSAAGNRQVQLAFSSVSSFAACKISGPFSVAQLTRSSRHTVRASVEGNSSEPGKEDSKFGLGGPGTYFGFGPKQERDVGRLAMVGFAAGVTMEVITGKGILAQLGINPEVVRFPFLAGMAFLLVAGLIGGYTVVNNPPDLGKAPPNFGEGVPRDPLKTFDPTTPDPLPTYPNKKEEKAE